MGPMAEDPDLTVDQRSWWPLVEQGRVWKRNNDKVRGVLRSSGRVGGRWGVLRASCPEDRKWGVFFVRRIRNIEELLFILEKPPPIFEEGALSVFYQIFGQFFEAEDSRWGVFRVFEGRRTHIFDFRSRTLRLR